jgi:hypothetical protein
VNQDFDRHRRIVECAPALLWILQRFPLSYRLKHLRQRLAPADAPLLSGLLREGSFRTVVTTAHRAAFWVADLKRRGLSTVRLVGIITDYALSAGWKHLDRSHIDLLVGPVPAGVLPADLRPRFRFADIPVCADIERLQGTKGEPQRGLVTGGGWGLGPLARITALLHGAFPSLSIDVCCGDNAPLFETLTRRYNGDSRVTVYPLVESIAPLLERCSFVVCRPGGLTITEVAHSGRALFLLPGLPVIEAQNRKIAVSRFGARPFSLEAVRSVLSGPRG